MPVKHWAKASTTLMQRPAMNRTTEPSREPRKLVRILVAQVAATIVFSLAVLVTLVLSFGKLQRQENTIDAMHEKIVGLDQRLAELHHRLQENDRTESTAKSGRREMSGARLDEPDKPDKPDAPDETADRTTDGETEPGHRDAPLPLEHTPQGAVDTVSPIDDSLAAARRCIARGEFESALTLLDGANTVDVDSPAMALARATALFALNRVSDAYAPAREAASHVPVNPQAMLLRGKIELALGLDVQADTTLTRAMRLDEVAVNAAALLCEHSVATGKLQRATELVDLGASARAGAKSDAGKDALQRCNMLLLCAQGEWGRCIELAKLQMTRHGASSELLAVIAKAQLQNGQAHDAIATARKWVQHDPTNADALAHLGLALLARLEPAEAALAFQRQVELSPEDATAWFHLGVALSNAGRPAAADRALTRSIELDEQHTPSLTARSIMRTRIDR